MFHDAHPQHAVSLEYENAQYQSCASPCPWYLDGSSTLGWHPASHKARSTIYCLVACTPWNGHLLALLWSTFFFQKQPSVVRPRPHLTQPRATRAIAMPHRGYPTPTQLPTLRWLALAPARLVRSMRIGARDRLPRPIAAAVRAPCRSVQHRPPPRSDNRRSSRPKSDAEPGG
jgi:hypothetical protein